jgi:hypothetical protein
MALPDANAAKTWGGKLLVDRDGTEIGTCTQIFVDDATGLPEWAAADLNGGPALVPLVDAAESGDRVRVAVRQVDVADAPPVGDAWHISVEEEERLYRHYGIDVSHAASESLLPVDEPVTPEPSSSAPPSTESEPEPTSDANGHRGRAPLLRGLAAVVVGAVAAIGATVFWWRHRQAPPTRTELLAARARAASLALGTRRAQVTTMTAPLLQAGRKLSETAAQRARLQARTASERAAAQSRAAAERAAAQSRAAAERAAAQSRAAAERAIVQSRAAAQQAAALAAVARTVRLQRVPAAADVQTEPVPPAAVADRPRRLVDVLEAGAGFAAGYALGARGEGRRFDRLTRTPTNWARSPQVQQAIGRVRVRATDTWQAGSAQVSRRAGGVTERVRRRSDRSEVPVGSEDSTPAS